MEISPLAKKLLIKPNQSIMVMNAPAGYLDKLRPLPAGARLLDRADTPVDFIQFFVKDSQELEKNAPVVIKAVKEDGLLWVCYPKGSSKVKTDLNRDILWAAMAKFGLAGVSMVSLDEVWSAMRLRPAARVGK